MNDDEPTDARSASEHTETERAPRRLSLAVSIATVAPAAILLVVSVWLATPPMLGRSLAALIWAAAIASTLRGLNVVARWVGIGPDPIQERWFWGTAFAVGLWLVAAYALGGFEPAAFSCIYSLELFVFWSIVRFAYRNASDASGRPPQKWRLRDILVVMAVVCLLAAGAHRVVPDPREIESLRIVGFVAASTSFAAFLALITLFFDAGIRVFVLESDEPDARMLTGVVAFGATTASIFGVAKGMIYDEPYATMVAGFVGSYLAIAVVQDILLARTIDAQEFESAANAKSP